MESLSPKDLFMSFNTEHSSNEATSVCNDNSNNAQALTPDIDTSALINENVARTPNVQNQRLHTGLSQEELIELSLQNEEILNELSSTYSNSASNYVNSEDVYFANQCNDEEFLNQNNDLESSDSSNYDSSSFNSVQSSMSSSNTEYDF